MISRALLRLPSPISNLLFNHLNRIIRLSSSPFLDATICPNNGATYSTNSAIKADNNGSAVYDDARKYARPPTVTWSDRLQNCVSLIGAVEFPLKQYDTQNGKFGVHTSLRVRTCPDSNSFFSITLEMWDELAERAMLHLTPNDYIYISGELGSYTKSLEGIEIVRYKVRAKELNYVKLDEPGKNSQKAVNSGKESGESTTQKYSHRVHMWQVFFASPNEWYDRRKTKKNPKGPDFKHKSTGEALWLNASDPPWVKKQLELLDSRLSGGPNNDVISNSSPSRWMSEEQLIVPHPSVKAEELSYIKLDEPGKNSHRATSSGKGAGEDLKESSLQKQSNRLHLWQRLFASPDEWDDQRKNKKNQREPDFKHKSTGEELWLNASDPSWVKKKVESLDSILSGGPKIDLTSKSKWVSDEQLIVPSATVLDLIHWSLQAAMESNVKLDETGKSSQKTVNSGNETVKHLGKSSLQKHNKLHLWQKLFASPDEWYDQRKNKKNPKSPDFKHKSTGEALWLNENDPPWVKKQVESLDFRFRGPKNVMKS
ncbi:Protein OSB1 mitochondrial [Bienertia sinuspersici]